MTNMDFKGRYKCGPCNLIAVLESPEQANYFANSHQRMVHPKWYQRVGNAIRALLV